MPGLTNQSPATDVGRLATLLQSIGATLNSVKCQLEVGALRVRQILTHLTLITDHELDEEDVLEK